MLYALKIASRYLTASKAQTALLIFGVAIGVIIFIFMSALIGGLAELILSRTAGDMAHITIQAEAVDPAVLIPGDVLAVQQKSSKSTTTLPTAASFIPMIAALPGVKAVAQEINGSGVLHQRVDFLQAHSLFDRAFHANQTNAVLVFQKLTHRTDSPVSQMVNIVDHALRVAQFY